MSQHQPGWGPSHQSQRKTPWWTIAAFVALMSIPFRDALLIMIAAAVLKVLWHIHRARHRRSAPGVQLTDDADPLQTVLAEHARRGGGVYLGVDANGGWVAARAERAVLVLGPPRSGKSSGVILPAVLSHAGAVVSTSTKPDVLTATAPSRARLGKVWQFDPTGSQRTDAADVLRWSPVTAGWTWDGALLIARAWLPARGLAPAPRRRATGQSAPSHC